MSRTLFAVAAAVLLAQSVSAQTFLPENDLRIPIGSAQDKGITSAQFNVVLDQVQAVYGPIIAAKGGKLVINRLWDNDTVNASAQRSGNRYIINMYGGLARHAAVTQDGFALVACHEIGHHIGGAPKIGGQWATNEGGADYFANLKCLRRLFDTPAAASFTRMAGQDDVAKAACNASFSKPAEQASCLRGVMAAISVTTLLAGGGALPNLSTPDPSVVDQTDDSHPEAQCRLDTYYQASLCPQPYKRDLSDADPAIGACVKSQGFSVGIRPRCWYKPPASETVPASRVEKIQTTVAQPVWD